MNEHESQGGSRAEQPEQHCVSISIRKVLILICKRKKWHCSRPNLHRSSLSLTSLSVHLGGLLENDGGSFSSLPSRAAASRCCCLCFLAPLFSADAPGPLLPLAAEEGGGGTTGLPGPPPALEVRCPPWRVTM